MDERVDLLLRRTGPILCIDIGGITQKALLARPGYSCENWPSFLLPSRSVLLGQRIRELTLLKRNFWLYGCEMGGGFNKALREHIAQGLKAASTSKAAASIHDNPQVVENMGIQITEYCPSGYVPIHCGDYDPEFWSASLRHASLPQPHMILGAVQDHGHSPDSNRSARLKKWEIALAEDPDPTHWIHEQVPENMTRMRALQQHTGGPVADTAACAILGALCVPQIFERSCREGITLFNAGNIHTLGALIYQGKVCAIYEHHTDKQDLKMLLQDIEQFRLRWLPSEKIAAQGGHGTVYASSNAGNGESFEPTYIMGPARELLKDAGAFLSPHGNMEFAGCFGLLFGWSRSHAKI